MWRIWFFFGILKINFAAPIETSQEGIIPSSELAVLKCLLSSPLNSCDEAKRSVEKIPKRIQKLYEKLKKPLFNTTKNEIVESAALETLPASLLYLIPKIRLSSMTGFTASDIVRKFPFDDALTMKILSLFTDKTTIKNFLSGLADREEMLLVSDDEIIEENLIIGIAPISPAVEKEIANAISRWFPNGSQWEYWLYKASMMTGTPVLASLPNFFLNSLSLETTERFLFHLRNWRSDSLNLYDTSWAAHGMSVRRIWASIVVNKAEPPKRWTPRILKQIGFILSGATPDELLELSKDLRLSHDFKLLFDISWNALQARAVFDLGYSSLNELNENELNKVKNLISHLLPRQIQQFSYNSTDFSSIKYYTGISLPTEKQLFYSYLSHLISKSKLKSIPETIWKDQISLAGKFYHLLPSSSLESFQNVNLELETLMKADSVYLSFRQARYLTNSGGGLNFKPASVLKLKGLLKSIPSIKLAQLKSNEISHSVKEHLLMYSSGESIPFTATILEKMRPDLAQTSYLEKIIYNKDFKQYFNLLGNRAITQKYRDFTSNLFEVVSRNPALERNIRMLPTSTLSALLSVHRREAIKKDNGWNYENLIESPLKVYIAGLTCHDIEMLETSDFMPVIGYYVLQRRAMNEMFPKNMQYCSQKALTKYLKLKASLRNLYNEPYGLLNFLELHEVRAVGGYILAGLPINTISTLGIKNEIIIEVGKLTIPELLTATSLENIKQFTDIYVNRAELINLKMITELGNLVWFLSEENISKLKPNDFKLHVESLEENAYKAMCFNERERNSWKNYLIQVFGKPDSWSTGTLGYLGDLLFVFDEYELERINKSSKTEASDVLTKSSSFFTTLEWPGRTKPIYLYEACLEILKISEKISYRNSIKQLFRFYLESSQFLLDTISTPQTILKFMEEPNLIESAPALDIPLIATEIGTHNSKENTEKQPVEKIENFENVTEFGEEMYDDTEEEDDFESSVYHSSNQRMKNSSNFDNKFLITDKTDSTSSKIYLDLIETQTEHLSASSKTNKKRDKMFETTSSLKNPTMEENQVEEEENSNIFRSKNSKSLDEIKEELQRNASRALIVEIPFNRTNFSNLGSTKHLIKISCDAIKMLGKPASLILDISDFENMDIVELEDCSEYLSTLDLDSKVKKYIWGKLKRWKESGNLMEVGSLVTAIGEDEITKIQLKLSEPWALENLHVLSTYIKDPEMMLFITDQFLLKNRDLQTLNYESTVALGRLVCSLTLSHQRKYLLGSSNVFLNAAKSLGRSLDCGNESCLRQLASIATSQDAFGETHKWNANDVSDLGIIVAGLKKSDWQLKDGKGLKSEALEGLTPAAASCIPSHSFKVLSEEQLSKIPSLSAAAITADQTSNLSPSQFEIIDRVRRQIPPEDLISSYPNSTASFKIKSSWFSFISINLSFYIVSRTFF